LRVTILVLASTLTSQSNRLKHFSVLGRRRKVYSPSLSTGTALSFSHAWSTNCMVMLLSPDGACFASHINISSLMCTTLTSRIVLQSSNRQSIVSPSLIVVAFVPREARPPSDHKRSVIPVRLRIRYGVRIPLAFLRTCSLSRLRELRVSRTSSMKAVLRFTFKRSFEVALVVSAYEESSRAT
jgi:hypothetical protein